VFALPLGSTVSHLTCLVLKVFARPKLNLISERPSIFLLKFSTMSAFTVRQLIVYDEILTTTISYLPSTSSDLTVLARAPISEVVRFKWYASPVRSLACQTLTYWEGPQSTASVFLQNTSSTFCVHLGLFGAASAALDLAFALAE
jgi:hypothetical protein